MQRLGFFKLVARFFNPKNSEQIFFLVSLSVLALFGFNEHFRSFLSSQTCFKQALDFNFSSCSLLGSDQFPKIFWIVVIGIFISFINASTKREKSVPEIYLLKMFVILLDVSIAYLCIMYFVETEFHWTMIFAVWNLLRALSLIYEVFFLHPFWRLFQDQLIATHVSDQVAFDQRDMKVLSSDFFVMLVLILVITSEIFYEFGYWAITLSFLIELIGFHTWLRGNLRKA